MSTAKRPRGVNMAMRDMRDALTECADLLEVAVGYLTDKDEHEPDELEDIRVMRAAYRHARAILRDAPADDGPETQP